MDNLTTGPMALALPLDSQLLKRQRSYRKRHVPRLAFYAFGPQTSGTTVSGHNWETKSALLSPVRSCPHQLWCKQEKHFPSSTPGFAVQFKAVSARSACCWLPAAQKQISGGSGSPGTSRHAAVVPLRTKKHVGYLKAWHPECCVRSCHRSQHAEMQELSPTALRLVVGAPVSPFNSSNLHE